MLSTESRMRGNMQVRFGGRYGKTYRRKAARRPVPSLRADISIHNITYLDVMLMLVLNSLNTFFSH